MPRIYVTTKPLGAASRPGLYLAGRRHNITLLELKASFFEVAPKILVMESLAAQFIALTRTMICPQPWLGGRKPPLLALLLLSAIHWVTALDQVHDFCRRYGHQTVVIDDKLYIDGGWVNYQGFPQNHQNYSSASILWMHNGDVNANLTE